MGISFYKLTQIMEQQGDGDAGLGGPDVGSDLGGGQGQIPDLSQNPQGPTMDQDDQQHQDSQPDEHEDHKEEQEDNTDVIKSGLNLDKDFWDNFMHISGNADGLSKLLGVSKDKIISWNSKIKSALEKVQDDESGDDEKTGERSNMIGTGNEIGKDDFKNNGQEKQKQGQMQANASNVGAVSQMSKTY